MGADADLTQLARFHCPSQTLRESLSLLVFCRFEDRGVLPGQLGQFSISANSLTSTSSGSEGVAPAFASMARPAASQPLEVSIITSPIAARRIRTRSSGSVSKNRCFQKGRSTQLPHKESIYIPKSSSEVAIFLIIQNPIKVCDKESYTGRPSRCVNTASIASRNLNPEKCPGLQP